MLKVRPTKKHIPETIVTCDAGVGMYGKGTCKWVVAASKSLYHIRLQLLTLCNRKSTKTQILSIELSIKILSQWTCSPAQMISQLDT